jgi:hypothetical protein
MGMVFSSKRFPRVEDQYKQTLSLPSSSFTNLDHFPTTTAAAMAQDVAGDPVNYEVHFMHSDNPRHGFCVMSMNPLTFYDFQTPVGFLETHTIVRADSSTHHFPFKIRANDKPTHTILLFYTQPGYRPQWRDRSNIQLVRMGRSGNNDVARSP